MALRPVRARHAEIGEDEAAAAAVYEGVVAGFAVRDFAGHGVDEEIYRHGGSRAGDEEFRREKAAVQKAERTKFKAAALDPGGDGRKYAVGGEQLRNGGVHLFAFAGVEPFDAEVIFAPGEIRKAAAVRSHGCQPLRRLFKLGRMHALKRRQVHCQSGRAVCAERLQLTLFGVDEHRDVSERKRKRLIEGKRRAVFGYAAARITAQERFGSVGAESRHKQLSRGQQRELSAVQAVL